MAKYNFDADTENSARRSSTELPPTGDNGNSDALLALEDKDAPDEESWEICEGITAVKTITSKP